MTDISYSIDETKLMMKLKWCKRKLKQQRHYSEYLKCKLAKKALQNYKLKERLSDYENNGWIADKYAEIERLKEENAQLTEWNLDMQNTDKDTEIARLNARIAELEAAQRWIPVSERLPNLFKTVIIARAIAAGRGGRFDLAFNCGLVWVGTQQDIEYEDVTHWMPLPQPPEVTK